MSTFVDLNRASYLKGSTSAERFNYLSAKYKNLKFLVPPSQNYIVSSKDIANSFGIAFEIYGDRGYWWIVCFYNGILNPISGFEPGMVLQLPSLADINSFLTSQDSRLVNSVII